MKRWIPLAISSKKFIISVAKTKNIVVFAFTYVLESFALFYGDFCMDLFGEWWRDTARQWSGKRFIASIFK